MPSAWIGRARQWIILSVPVVVVAVSIWAAPEGSARWKQFISEEGGYIAYYPPGWHVFPPSNAPQMNIYNFPFSRSGGGVLPDGGASIALLTPPTGVASEEQWIDRNSKHEKDQSKELLVLRRAGTETPIQVTQVISRSDGDSSEEQFEGVDCYFEISGKLFVARLTYWKGDPKAENYRQTLHGVIQRVALLNRQPR